MSTAPSDTPAATPPPTGHGEGHLRRVLGVPSLVLFGLVYIVPLTVFTTYGIVVQTSGGRLAVSYLVDVGGHGVHRSVVRADGRRIPGGGFDVRVHAANLRATDRIPRRMVASAGLPASCRCSNYLVIGIYLNAAIPAVPPWVFVLITIAIVTVLNIIGIVSVARANMLIIVMQAVFIVVFLVLAVRDVVAQRHSRSDGSASTATAPRPG